MRHSWNKRNEVEEEKTKAGTTTWMRAMRFRVTTGRVIHPASSRRAKKYVAINIMGFWVIGSREVSSTVGSQWHLKSPMIDAFRVNKDADFNELEPPASTIRSVRTRRNLWAISSRTRASSFSFEPTEPPSVEIASAFPPDHCFPSRTTCASSKNWKVHREMEKFNVTSNLIYSPPREHGRSGKSKNWKV